MVRETLRSLGEAQSLNAVFLGKSHFHIRMLMWEENKKEKKRKRSRGFPWGGLIARRDAYDEVVPSSPLRSGHLSAKIPFSQENNI